ncbi:V-type H+-transporting ATPase subunit I [Strigomonas culicis]|uniref:V-type proton ATPase subunit a n=1 Tax=Strigomonas culicis TaxID=28005 RepID=S9V805_9TRYP|nr:V-type H+-transporting ATPase subunit I [Strigomonas culicis]|eukprot:EPY19085.1 V-type H+-transporting ATPase subunit I [Strigomonas culicis]
MSWTTERCSGLWRSEDMVRLNIIIQREVLHDTIFKIGLMGKVQFLDMDDGAAAFSKPYTNEIRRCEDLQRKLRVVEEHILQEPPTLLEKYNDIEMSASVGELREATLEGQLDNIDERVEALLTDLMAMVTSLEGLQNEMNNNQQLITLYRRMQSLMNGEAEGSRLSVTDTRSTSFLSSPVLTSFSSLSSFNTVIGLVNTAQADVLYRICYRVTRGNALILIYNEPDPFVDPKTGERNVALSSFIILSSSQRMVQRIYKLIGGLKTIIYALDEVSTRGAALSEQAEELARRAADHRDSGDGLSATHVRVTLTTGGGSTNQDQWSHASVASPVDRVHSNLQSSAQLQQAMDTIRQRKQDLLLHWYEEHRLYKTIVRLEKTILTTMNLCAVSGATCTASVWIPCRYESMLEQALHEAVYASGEVHSIITRHVHQTRPPTYYETNKFTSSFQSIVDSYGMARYKEVNPGVFTIITFPYLFGIMYGDIGHGILLLCISLFFIYKERSWTGQPLNEIIGMIFGGRYLLLLMSLFATYMGFLYNDFFGFSVNIFKSGYTWPSLETRNKSEHTMYPSNPNGLPSVKPPHVYVFGLDVAWAETENKLEFYNSVKMKCAVVVGVTQMFAGVILSLNNHIYNKDWLRIAFLTVPEFLFLLVTFGYMSILIIVKWCTTWESTHDAPSLLETMTNFFLQPTSLSNPLFAGQMGLQIFFLLVALLMVPLMLCGMPVIEYRKYQRYLARQRKWRFRTWTSCGMTRPSPPSGRRRARSPWRPAMMRSKRKAPRPSW